ncbi:unnamed protein product [Clavelina lepadiformis]|uniref:Uncharacterized protein n=1 Tax=Clavelina lepadiformis TaxID=159417 RepID=A0ABP0FUW3_CLALP
MSDNLIAPVQHAVPASSIQSSVPKSTITKRNVKAKKGLGAKKVGGLGGKKVAKADFVQLEKNAEEEDKVKHRLSVSSGTSDGVKAKIEESSAESFRLAYQDITVKEKQNNMKLSKMDLNKKEQAQRLGMGMGRTDGVSHSMDMKTINQVTPVKTSRRGKYKDKDDIFYDAFSSSSKSRGNRWDDSDSDDDNASDSGRKDFYPSSKKSSKDDPLQTFSITPITDTHRADSTVFMPATTSEPKANRQRNIKKPSNSATGEDYLNKFKGAQAISSDMLFGSSGSQYNDEQNIKRFEGYSGISSDQYHGRSQSYRSNPGGHMEDIKDGVKEGVRSVAGKLSNIASDLASTLQDRYG